MIDSDTIKRADLIQICAEAMQPVLQNFLNKCFVSARSREMLSIWLKNIPIYSITFSQMKFLITSAVYVRVVRKRKINNKSRFGENFSAPYLIFGEHSLTIFYYDLVLFSNSNNCLSLNLPAGVLVSSAIRANLLVLIFVGVDLYHSFLWTSNTKVYERRSSGRDTQVLVVFWKHFYNW